MAKKRPRYKKGPKKGKFMSNRAIAAQKAARKRGKKKSSKKKTSKRRSSKRTTARSKSMPKKKTRRRSRKNAKVMSGKHLMEVAGAGAAFGYIEQMPNSILADMPQIEAVGFDGTMAIALHFGSKAFGRGAASKWLSRAAEAYAGSAGLEFGRRGLKSAGMTGDEGGRPAVMAGSVSYDEANESFEHGS